MERRTISIRGAATLSAGESAMADDRRPIEEVIARDLHSLLYLEEFAFARNKFSPPGRSEVELADAVVVLGDTLIVFQIKERSQPDSGDAEKELDWFRKRVHKQA